MDYTGLAVTTQPDTTYSYTEVSNTNTRSVDDVLHSVQKRAQEHTPMRYQVADGVEYEFFCQQQCPRNLKGEEADFCFRMYRPIFTQEVDETTWRSSKYAGLLEHEVLALAQQYRQELERRKTPKILLLPRAAYASR